MDQMVTSVEIESEDDILARALEESLRYYNEVELPFRGSQSCPDENNFQPFSTSNSTSVSSPLLYEGQEAKGFDLFAGRSWIYPTNYEIRQYQLDIVGKAMFKNTLICLPTGLGKTFVAAVIMYNYYRWYPQGKVIFMAPTKPLVHQQVDACCNMVGISRSDTAEMTGATSPTDRIELWERKRVFFLTPHVVANDLSRGVCPADKLKCVVIDEAHKAVGNNSYVQMMRMLFSLNSCFRVVALSATPGGDMLAVQQVLNNLKISHVEFRTEDSPDVKPFVHNRNVETVVVSLGEHITQLQKRFLEILSVYTQRLRCQHVLHCSIPQLTKFGIFKERDMFRTKPPANLSKSQFGKIESDFAVCITLYHALELLEVHGLRSFYNFLHKSMEDGKQPFLKSILNSNESLISLLNDLKGQLGPDQVIELDPDVSIISLVDAPRVDDLVQQPHFCSHPKLVHLKSIIKDHFLSFQECDTSTRVMVFCQYRDTVIEISHILGQLRPLVKPMTFLGQSTVTNQSRGFTQKQQLMVMEKFRSGKYNVLVATCVAEEGLDIGEVDLIVCFDAHVSPIRLVQRMGRTGRNREGRVVMLITQGREFQKYKLGQAKTRTMQLNLVDIKKLNPFLYKDSPSMIPNGKPRPQMYQMHLTIEAHSTSKTKVLKNQDLRKHFTKKSDMESPYCSKEEFAEIWDGNIPAFKKLPDCQALFACNRQELHNIFTHILEEEMEGCNSPLNLGHYIDWQKDHHSSFLIDHSVKTNQLVELLQKSGKAKSSCLLTQTAGFASQVNVNVLWPGKKRRTNKSAHSRRLKKEAAFADVCTAVVEAGEDRIPVSPVGIEEDSTSGIKIQVPYKLGPTKNDCDIEIIELESSEGNSPVNSGNQIKVDIPEDLLICLAQHHEHKMSGQSSLRMLLQTPICDLFIITKENNRKNTLCPLSIIDSINKLNLIDLEVKDLLVDCSSTNSRFQYMAPDNQCTAATVGNLAFKNVKNPKSMDSSCDDIFDDMLFKEVKLNVNDTVNKGDNCRPRFDLDFDFHMEVPSSNIDNNIPNELVHSIDSITCNPFNDNISLQCSTNVITETSKCAENVINCSDRNLKGELMHNINSCKYNDFATHDKLIVPLSPINCIDNEKLVTNQPTSSTPKAHRSRLFSGSLKMSLENVPGNGVSNLCDSRNMSITSASLQMGSCNLINSQDSQQKELWTMPINGVLELPKPNFELCSMNNLFSDSDEEFQDNGYKKENQCIVQSSSIRGHRETTNSNVSNHLEASMLSVVQGIKELTQDKHQKYDSCLNILPISSKNIVPSSSQLDEEDKCSPKQIRFDEIHKSYCEDISDLVSIECKVQPCTMVVNLKSNLLPTNFHSVESLPSLDSEMTNLISPPNTKSTSGTAAFTDRKCKKTGVSLKRKYPSKSSSQQIQDVDEATITSTPEEPIIKLCVSSDKRKIQMGTTENRVLQNEIYKNQNTVNKISKLKLNHNKDISNCSKNSMDDESIVMPVLVRRKRTFLNSSSEQECDGVSDGVIMGPNNMKDDSSDKERLVLQAPIKRLSKAFKECDTKRREFVLGEADVSVRNCIVSSDDEDTSGLDEYDSSFLNDSLHEGTSIDHQAKYLHSIIRSPAENKKSYRKPRRDYGMDIFSQPLSDNDESYLEDSFCVDNTSENDTKEISMLEMAEAALKKRSKRNRLGFSTPKQSRIIIRPDNSSSESSPDQANSTSVNYKNEIHTSEPLSANMGDSVFEELDDFQHNQSTISSSKMPCTSVIRNVESRDHTKVKKYELPELSTNGSERNVNLGEDSFQGKCIKYNAMLINNSQVKISDTRKHTTLGNIGNELTTKMLNESDDKFSVAKGKQFPLSLELEKSTRNLRIEQAGSSHTYVHATEESKQNDNESYFERKSKILTSPKRVKSSNIGGNMNEEADASSQMTQMLKELDNFFNFEVGNLFDDVNISTRGIVPKPSSGINCSAKAETGISTDYCTNNNKLLLKPKHVITNTIPAKVAVQKVEPEMKHSSILKASLNDRHDSPGLSNDLPLLHWRHENKTRSLNSQQEANVITSDKKKQHEIPPAKVCKPTSVEAAPVVIVASRQVGCAPEILMELRRVHGVSVSVMTVQGADYVISYRLGVIRLLMSDFQQMSYKPSLVTTVQLMHSLFQDVVFIVENNKDKPVVPSNNTHMWTKSLCVLLATLRKAKVKLFYSKDKIGTTEILVKLAKQERDTGRGIMLLPQNTPVAQQKFTFYQNLPGVNVALALQLYHNFTNIKSFLSCCRSVQGIQRATNLDTTTCSNIYLVVSGIIQP